MTSSTNGGVLTLPNEGLPKISGNVRALNLVVDLLNWGNTVHHPWLCSLTDYVTSLLVITGWGILSR